MRARERKRADQDRVVPALAGEADIVGEGRGDAQIDAARRGLAAQEIGLHLQVAIAEQHHVEPPPRRREVGERPRRRAAQ